MFSDGCRANFDYSNGLSSGWVKEKLDIPVRLRRQQNGGHVLGSYIWLQTHEPFQVPDDMKMTPRSCKKSLPHEIHPPEPGEFVFMHDNAFYRDSLVTRVFLRIF